MRRVSAQALDVIGRARRRLRAAAWALALSLLAAVLPAGRAYAAKTANIDFIVTFTGVLSVAVDGVAFSTRAFTAGANALVVGSSATVTNDSRGLISKWALSVSTISGGGDWAVVGSTATPPDVDQFALQALFISSATQLSNQPGSWSNGCPAANASDWNNYASTVTGATTQYGSRMYADPTVVGGASGLPDMTSGQADGRMYPVRSGTDGRGVRGLCTRIYMPSGTETLQPQGIRMTVWAVPD